MLRTSASRSLIARAFGLCVKSFRELRYQSSLELSEGVYNTVTKLPLARDLFSDSRQQLVARLDQMYSKHNATFHQAVELIQGACVHL